MDTSQFDQFTKALVTKSISRRGTLKSFAATALGGILALSGVGDAFARSESAQTPARSWGDEAPEVNRLCPDGTGCSHLCRHRSNCFCVTTAEGKKRCVHPVCTGVACNHSSDCPSGQVCFTQGCCGAGKFCVPVC